MKLKLLLFFFTISIVINAQNAADIDLVVGNGYVGFSRVSAIAVQSDGKIIVGGTFNMPIQGLLNVGRVARFNVDGSLDNSFQIFPYLNDGIINDILILPNGKILVGGNFSMMNDVAIYGLIRLNPDGTKDDSFIDSVSGAIFSLALQPDGKVVVGGNISAYINEHLQNRVIRINQDGSLDTTFDFGVEGFVGPSSVVYRVVVQNDGKILVGGAFSAFNGVPQGKLIRFNADGTKDLTFDIGTGAVGSIYLKSIAQQTDGKILIGGGFLSWNGQPTGTMCRLNTDGSLDESFNLGVPCTFSETIAILSNGKIVSTGLYKINNINRRLVTLNTDGSLDTTFQVASIGAGVNTLCLQTDDKILIGGFMNEYNGVLKNSFARINTNGTLDTSFNLNTGLNDKVESITLQNDGKTILSGNFTTFDGASQNRIIRLSPDGSKDNSFAIGTGFNNSVKKAVVLPNGKIIVGGSFTAFNGAVANFIIRLNSNGMKDDSFNTGLGFNDFVKTIAIQSDGKILVGGNFTEFNGQTQKYCVRLNEDGSLDNTFGNEITFNNKVTYLTLQADGKILVGGNFTTFNGQSQKGLIRLNIDGTKDTSFDIGTGFDSFNSSDVVRDIEILMDGSMYVASQGGNYNGVNAGNPIRLFTDGSRDTSFSNQAVINSQGTIESLAIQQDGKIIVGGNFVYVNNTDHNRIMRLNSNGTLDTTFDVNNGNSGSLGGLSLGSCNEIIIQPDGKIWLGGSFFTYQSVCSFSAVRLVGDEVLSIDNFDNTKNEIVIYPNPIQNFLNLNEYVKSIKIISMTGKTLAFFEHTNLVDFSEFAEGLYLLHIEQNNGNITTKKVVKR
ncbi:T9SS type A sorting domain-containing protein [Yeosuana sp.]